MNATYIERRLWRTIPIPVKCTLGRYLAKRRNNYEVARRVDLIYLDIK
jgi:hypothetical protein